MHRLACLIACFIPLPLMAAETTSFALDNGLDVVVLEDHRAPVVVQMLWYKAGAADEPPGTFRHRTFSGTSAVQRHRRSGTGRIFRHRLA